MTRKPYDPALSVHVAKGAHYACRMCGGGCRSYDVLLTEQEANRLSYSWWRSLLNGVPDDLSLVTLDPASDQYTLSRVDDRCVFLDTDNLCIIHKTAGLDAKPIACQFFPFQAVQTPNGLQTSLNVSCRRLVEMTEADPPLDVEAGRSLLGRAQAVATLDRSIPFTNDTTIDYPTFSDYQAHLASILTVPESTWTAVFDRLGAAAAYLLALPDLPIVDQSDQSIDGLTLFHALNMRMHADIDRRSSLRALYRRSGAAIESILTNGLFKPMMSDDALAAFCAQIARQWLEGDQAALHRTAYTGWSALIVALLLGIHGTAAYIAAGQRPDHALNESIADAVDLCLSPAGRIALSESNQVGLLHVLVFHTQ